MSRLIGGLEARKEKNIEAELLIYPDSTASIHLRSGSVS